MERSFAASYLDDARSTFRHYKELADAAIAQVTDDQLYAALDPESNSIAILIKHLAGNMISRWTDFLTADGEKPDRNRDSEFLDPPPARAALLEYWEKGCECMFSTLDSLSENDLDRTVVIRGERHSVVQAINRQMTHFAGHCGQIILLAKHFQEGNWKTLSIPRGKSRGWTPHSA